MTSEPDPSRSPVHKTSVSDRRASERRPTESEVSLVIEGQTIHGQTDNVSGVGILFFSEEQLSVQVSWDDEGTSRTRTGRLVRAQRVDGERLGFAVEFDAA